MSETVSRRRRVTNADELHTDDLSPHRRQEGGRTVRCRRASSSHLSKTLDSLENVKLHSALSLVTIEEAYISDDQKRTRDRGSMSGIQAVPPKGGYSASPRYGRRVNTSHDQTFYSTTSAWSSSYDTENTRDDNYTERDDTFTERDATRSQREVSFSQKDISASNVGYVGERSADRYHLDYEKNEWSCDGTGGWQKLSVLLLGLGFLCHLIAVTTPYWTAGYMSQQMVLYEGIWVSCYRETTVGRWICTTYNGIRKVNGLPCGSDPSGAGFSHPAASFGRHDALHLHPQPQAPFAGLLGLYRLVVVVSDLLLPEHRGLRRGYPDKQDFPPGEVYYHFSFALQIIGFLLCLASLSPTCATRTGLKVWGNLSCQSARSTEVSKRAPSVGSFASSNKPFPREHSRSPAQPRSSKLLSGFALLKLPLALSKFNRGKSQQSAAPTEKATVPIVTATNEEYNPFPARCKGDHRQQAAAGDASRPQE
ncbi:hypothetical protein C0Q70_08054 [Pomacea canaliculata]|uniref:Uncharacterized protein n=1 Tax=Pomacea canaliculata TaxID=400727 RepID=A0A2T7PGR4_POMCA|nr:hypothetical protein C0Q70_08054 [Pomacea canaliculata]